LAEVTTNNPKIPLEYNTPYQTSYAEGQQQYASATLQVDLWPFDLESGVQVMCDVGYLCTTFSLPRPLCSRLRPDVRDRQTDVRRQAYVI